MIPYEHTAGAGWARFFAWTSLGIGAASLAVAFLVPLAGEIGRVAVVAFFGGFAIWFGLMARSRFRAIEHPVSWPAVLGTVLGILTMVIMAYAMFALIMAIYYGVLLPMAPNWIAGISNPGVGIVPGVDV
ncbi:hypothetical protein ACWEOH_10870 [Agromyces sp. NPDC004153]